MVVNGPAATATAARSLSAEKPDLAIIDINLNGEMAYDLIDQLHDQGVRIVVVSGYSVLPRSSKQCAAVLQKPFNGPELLAALRSAL
jgi:DNA-binding response OmpR family regulator